MVEELLEKIISYLGADYTEDQESILLVVIDRAMESFKSYVNYPKSFTDEKIQDDLKKHKYCLFDLTMYWYAKQGLEFQDTRSENGVGISFQNESEIFSLHGIVPYAEI